MIIEHDVVGAIITMGVPLVPVETIMKYDSQDPLAVIFSFNVNCDWSDDPVVWHFGRKILADAISYGGVQGDPNGDVKALHDVEDPRFTIFLDSPEGTASVEFPADKIFAFVREVYECVPEDETDKIIEDELAIFLDSLEA